MKRFKKQLLTIGFLGTLMIREQSLQAQTVNLNDSEPSRIDEIKAALKVEQRNYDNLASMLKDGTSEARNNQHFQESWLRWINSRVKEIGNQDDKASSCNKILRLIRNRSESIAAILDYNKRNEQELISQSQDREKILTSSTDLILEGLLKNLVFADFPMDVHPEEAIKNNQGLKQVEDIPQVVLGSSDEAYNKQLMEDQGIRDIDSFISAASIYTLGKTKKEDVRKDVAGPKMNESNFEGDRWIILLRGIKMKMDEHALAFITFDKNGFLKNVIVTKSDSSGKETKVFDSDDKTTFKNVASDRPDASSTDTKNSNFNFQINLPKKIAILLQEGDISKLIEALQKNLAISNRENVTNQRIRLYNLIILARLEIEANNINMASMYVNMADDIFKNRSVFRPADVCLKDIYLSKVRMYNGDQKGAEEALSSAIQLFLDKIDIGYPVSEHQSSLLAGIVTNLFQMAALFQNTEYLKSNLSIMNDSAMNLITTPEDNLSSPGEQLFLDSYKVVLIYSEVLLKTGKYNESIKLVDDCIISSYRRQNRYNDFSKESIYYLDALEIKAIALNQSGEKQSAKNVADEWLQLYKQRFSDVVQCFSEQQRLLFSSKQRPLDFLMQMDDPLAVANLLFFYKGSVIDSILTSKAIINNSEDTSLKQQLCELDYKKSEPNAKQDISAIEKELANQVRNRFKESDVLGVIKNQNFRELPKVLPKQSAFIDYFKYETFGKLKSKNSNYGAIVITDNGTLSLVRLAECKKIDTLVDDFRKINSTFTGVEKDAEMTGVCRSLYDELIEPLKTHLGKSTDLIISPEGKLNFIPFASFLDRDGKFTVQSAAIHYVSSGRDLLKDFEISPNKSMTIVANPIFNKDSSASTKESIFPQLPGTAIEAQLVQDAMTNGNYSVSLFDGTNASKNSLMHLDHPKILHIATHGFNLINNNFDADGHPTRGMRIIAGDSALVVTNMTEKPNPMFKTGLAFYGANDTFSRWNSGELGSSEGILTAAEVPLLNLNGTCLVTLSACQTGEGEVVGGEGVFGLRRGFLQSGAKNLLMTLWPIADQETVSIMSEFYKKIAGNDEDPGNSLSEVQREWMPKLMSEKGICYAINRSAPFVIFTKGKIVSSNFSGIGVSESQSNHNITDKPVAAPNSIPQNQFSPAILEFSDALTKADAGDAYAQGVISIYYTMGYKVPKDTAKGLTYALKSAAQKNPLGIYQVGALRVLGVGMKKDKSQGRKLISEAIDGLNAMNGDPYALYDLGLMALEGVGVDQNPKEAARLFKVSADLGYAPAQRMYAKFLEAGVGVPKDLEAARQYQSQSSAQWSEQ